MALEIIVRTGVYIEGDVGESEEGALEQELRVGRFKECVIDALDVEWVDGTPRENAADGVDIGFDDGRCGVEVGEPVGGGPECINESALRDVEQPVCAEAWRRAELLDDPACEAADGREEAVAAARSDEIRDDRPKLAKPRN
jgi:hypothetical protein